MIPRKKPIPRKRMKPRIWKTPRCEYETPTGRRPCKKPQDVKWGEVEYGAIGKATGALVYGFGLCRPHARQEALARWSFHVRSRGGFVCELAAWHQSLGVRCGGFIVGCHGFGKGAYPSVMFELWNGFSGCSGINNWTEDHPLEWDDFLRATWGNAYEERRRQALSVRKYDLGEVLARLTSEKEKAG